MAALRLQVRPRGWQGLLTGRGRGRVAAGALPGGRRTPPSRRLPPAPPARRWAGARAASGAGGSGRAAARGAAAERLGGTQRCRVPVPVLGSRRAGPDRGRREVSGTVYPSWLTSYIQQDRSCGVNLETSTRSRFFRCGYQLGPQSWRESFIQGHLRFRRYRKKVPRSPLATKSSCLWESGCHGSSWGFYSGEEKRPPCICVNRHGRLSRLRLFPLETHPFFP